MPFRNYLYVVLKVLAAFRHPNPSISPFLFSALCLILSPLSSFLFPPPSYAHTHKNSPVRVGAPSVFISPDGFADTRLSKRCRQGNLILFSLSHVSPREGEFLFVVCVDSDGNNNGKRLVFFLVFCFFLGRVHSGLSVE